MGSTFKVKWIRVRSTDIAGHLKGMRTILLEGGLFEKDEHGEDCYIGKYLIIRHFTANGKEYYEIYHKARDAKTGVGGWYELALVEYDPQTDRWRYTNKQNSSGWYRKFLRLWGLEKEHLIVQYLGI